MKIGDWLTPLSPPGTRKRRSTSAVVLGLAVVLAVGGIFTGAFFVGFSRGSGTMPTKEDATKLADAELPAGGKQFAESCGGCHALKAAGTSGTAGPNLDASELSAEIVLRKIETGGPVMPKGLVTGKAAEDVAAYVAEVSGK